MIHSLQILNSPFALRITLLSGILIGVILTTITIALFVPNEYQPILKVGLGIIIIILSIIGWIYYLSAQTNNKEDQETTDKALEGYTD